MKYLGFPKVTMVGLPPKHAKLVQFTHFHPGFMVIRNHTMGMFDTRGMGFIKKHCGDTFGEFFFHEAHVATSLDGNWSNSPRTADPDGDGGASPHWGWTCISYVQPGWSS